MIVNLLDGAFRHSVCSVHGKVPQRIQYVRDRLRWDGVTLITDDFLCLTRWPEFLDSKIKIGWLMECREYKPENYAIAASAGLLRSVDLLLTHDSETLYNFPGKARFVPYGGSWIRNIGIQRKHEAGDVCQIVSRKEFMPGHQLRHEIAQLDGIESYGSGSDRGEITYRQREALLGAHRFAVVVENSRAMNYFTEKLLDCFAVGTVPIYWGAPNIGHFFNLGGIIPFDSAEELPAILRTLDYGWHKAAIEDNLERMREYEVTEDWIYSHILKEMEA
jgi:hypothetical protein